MLPSVPKPSITLTDEDVLATPLPTADMPKASDATDINDLLKNLQALSNSTKIQAVTKTMKRDEKRRKFIEKVDSVLSHLSKMCIFSENELENVTLFVLQSCEDFLTTAFTRDEKIDICVDLLKRFTKDDHVLCKQIISFVIPKLKPSTFLRRNKKIICSMVYFFLPQLEVQQLRKSTNT